MGVSMVIKKYKGYDILGVILFGIALALSAVSVYLCFSDDIWYDELFTIGLAGSSYRDLISIAAADVHPPLYYLIVKFILDGCNLIFTGASAFAPGLTSEAAIIIVKIVSVLPFLLLFAYCMGSIRKYFGMLCAGLFAFCVISMSQLSAYTTEMRMYGFAMFFITAGMIHAYEAVTHTGSRCKWIGITAYGLAAMYTHYFAAVAAAMMYLYLLVSFLFRARTQGKRWKDMITVCKPVLLSGMICAIGYLPWISAVIFQVGQVSDNYWILPLTIKSIGGCVKFLFKPAFLSDTLNTLLAVLLFLIYCGVLAYGLMQIRIAHKNKMESKTDSAQEFTQKFTFSIALLLVLIGVVLFGFIASFLLRPVFIYRYMLPAAGAFWLCFVLLLGEMKDKKWFFYPVLCLLVIIGLRNYRAFYGEEMWKKVQMEATKEAFEQISDQDILVFNFLHTQGVTACYLPNESRLMWSEPEELVKQMYSNVHGFDEIQESQSDVLGREEDVEASQIKNWLKQGKTVWFLGSGNVREEIRDEFALEGIETNELGSFLIERYWFNLYSVTGT